MALHTPLLGMLPSWKNSQVDIEVAMSAFVLEEPSDFFRDTSPRFFLNKQTKEESENRFPWIEIWAKKI